MLEKSGTKQSCCNDQGFNTPTKNLQKSYFQQITRHDTSEIQNQSNRNVHLSNTSDNLQRKRRNQKRIKKSNFKLLEVQKDLLSELKKKTLNSNSDVLKESYYKELDTVYVILARIDKISQSNKFYVLHCQDSTSKTFKLHFPKHFSKELEPKKSETFYDTERIHEIEKLEFESNAQQGTPYFKFFVIFRQVPLFEESEEQVVIFDQNEQKSQKIDESYKKRLIPRIKGNEYRACIKHFSKVTDFNEIVWHNKRIIFEHLSEKIMNLKNPKLQLE